MSQTNGFHGVSDLIEDLRQGRMIILVDDEDRENEGDLVLPAQFATPEAINFMAKEARGLICLALDGAQVDRLGLKPMVDYEHNTTPNKTAFTVSIEAASGVSTGISAADRAHTIRVASHPEATARDIRSPGHVFPLRAQKGGVLKRAGHTEGSVDLMRLAGLWPAAVICEIMNADGSMARVPDLLGFSRHHGIKIGTIADLIAYRLERERLVHECQDLTWDLNISGWKVRVFESLIDGWHHLVLQKGFVDREDLVVRIQREDGVKAVLEECRGGYTLSRIWQKLNEFDNSLWVILRGQNLQPKLDDWNAPLIMDHRDYGLGAQILKACGVHRFRLLTNHPERRVGLNSFGLEIIGHVGF